MKQQAPIFSQLLFTQVLANVGGSLQRFHQSNNQCFEAIIATPQKDLLLYSPGAYNDKPLLLPILESLPLLPEAKKDRFSLAPIPPLKTTLSNFFSMSKTSEKLFESTYFSPSFIKSISKAPFKSYQRFSKSKLPHDIHPVLNTIQITLERLIQTFPSASFWSTNEHYRYLKRFLSKVTLLQQSMTIDTADTYLSLIPTILHHLNESAKRVYTIDSDTPESFSDDFYLWNTHLENYILLFKAISESFLFITLFKLHFHQLLLQTLSQNKKNDHSLDNLNQLVSDNQTKYVYQLCYQQGLLCDISNQFKDLSSAHSTFNISDDSFSNEIKEAYFKVKNSLFEFESIIPQTSSQTWVNYFQLCFSYNLSDIGLHLITNYFDVFPTYELTDAIGEAITSSLKKINTHISELPKSIQNQSNTALKIKPELYHCLYKEIHALFRLLFWSTILTCHLCLTGRYSLIPNCLIKIYSSLSTVDFSSYYLNFVAVIFNPKIFHHHLDFLTQIHPESLLETIDSAIILYPTDPTITLQNHSSLNPWFNSPNFINRWVSLFRSQLFLHPHEGWTALYPFMTYPFLSRSHLIETWIEFAPTHTLERNCLTRMIHSIARTSPDDLRLFFLYIRTKHISLELPELAKIKLSFSLTESTLKDFISHIKFLYESDYSENLYAITLITQQLLDYCESLHATYSCDVTSYLINEHLSSLLFILTINLKHKLATCYPLIQFIGIYYILDSQIYHTIHQSLSEMFSSIEKTPETLELLHRTHKTTPELSQLFLALLVRYFSTPSTSEDYVLDLDEANTLTLKSQSSRYFDKNTYAMDPFYLLHEITQFLLQAYPMRLNGDIQSYEFVEIKTTIESWLKRNHSFLLLYLDKTIGLSLETLIQHALNGNSPRFLNQRNHLRSLIFTLQSLSFLQKLILSHTLNLCSLLLDTPSNSHYFCSLSLFLFDFKSISSKSFIFFCLQMFHNDYKTSTGLTEFNISTFQELFAQYKHLNTNFDDVDFIFLEHSLSTLQTLFLLIPEYETTKQQQLFSLFNIVLDYYEIIPEDSVFLKGFIYKTLPIFNAFFESGFINYFHPFFNAILSYHHTESNPNEDLEKAYLYIKDYQLIHNCLNLNNPINFNLFEALLEKPYIQTSLTHIFAESPGMCLHFSLFLLTHIETLSPESHDHGISQFLNHIFNQSLSLQQWKNARFVFHLLTVFYNYSSTTQPLDHMIELSVKEHDKAIMSSLLLKTPQQAKQLILRLQDVSQSAHPIIKNILLSLLDHTIKNQLSDPYLTIKSIENKSLKECLIIKSEIDQNISHALTQLHRLITTVAYAPLQESILESFILKALIYLKQFSNSISFLPTIDHESENYIDQLLGIILSIDTISTTLTDLNPELFQDINRHLCQIIAQIILEPHYGKCLNAQRLDFLFATHHQLLLDELKTLIIDSQTLSFQQVQNLLALLSNAPEQLTYNRFSEWFIYLDVLKFIQDDDITLVLFECCLAHPRLVIDSIQNHQNPQYYFQILADESPSLAFYLLNILVQSSLESDLNLVTECQQIITNNPILSYLVSSKKSSHFIDDLIQYVYSTEAIPINKRRNLITNLLPNYQDLFSFFLELLFLQNNDLFWTLCHDETLGLFNSIIELTYDTPTIFSTTFLYHCFTHPMFLAHLTDISERSRYHSVPPLLIHASILKNPASVHDFSCNDLIGWINTCYLFNQLDTCFHLLHTRDHYSVDCFYEMFFNHMAQTDISYNAEIFLDYLCKFTDLYLKSFITHLNDHYAITYHDFAVFLLNAISKSAKPHTYTQLQIRCTPYLSQLNHIHAQLSISESSTYMISLASVCHIQELSIGDICQFLKECNYIPSAINPNHLSLLADAIFNESHHHFLTDLSLHYPNLFETLLFKPPFATAIQQALFYEELHPESLLYNHIINAIDRLSYNQLLQFLGVYVQKHFTSQKHQKSVELLTSFIPFSSENVRNNFDHLETQLLTLVNTPIPRVGSNDPIIQLIFQSLPKLRHQLDITEQLYCFLSTDTAMLSHHGIDFIHIKKHLELCCSSTDNRMKLLHYCQHHYDERSFHIFSRLIDHWEEKNSLFDTFNLYLTKGHEHHIFHDYLLAMATRVTYFSFENFKLNRFKKLCVAIHFLLVYSPEKLHLQHWFVHYLIPNLKAAYFNYVAAIFSSNLIDQSILKDLAIGFITHKKTACYSSLFKASFFQPFFRDIWEHFIASSKEHIILSDLLVESSALHQSVELFMRNFIEKSPQNFFDFCTIHYNHKIYIDIFFKKLYNYYFNQTMIDTSSISMSQDNPLIGLTQTAIKAQETGFLFFLARCIENHLIPNQKNVSWIIECLNKTYRLSFSTLPHSIDSSLQNTIKKLFLSSGLLTDSGEFLEELPSLSLEQFKENNPTLTMNPAMEFAYVNLHQAAIAHFHQRNHFFTCFLSEAPTFFIQNTPATSHLGSDANSQFFEKAPAYIDYLFYTLHKNNQGTLAFKEFSSLISQNNVLKPLFFNYLKCLPSDQLLSILKHPSLTLQFRHFVLFGILYDEKESNKFSDNTSWETRVVHSLLKDLSLAWLSKSDTDSPHIHIEILLFFFIHFPSAIKSNCHEYYSSILESTGINFPKLFYGVEHIEMILSQPRYVVLTLDLFLEIIENLFATGFSLFDCIFCFKACSYYDSSIEHEWLSTVLKKEPMTAYSITPNWMHIIYELMCTDQKIIYVPDSFFETTVYHHAFKKWLITEGHLTSKNCLTLLTYQDFLSFYNPSEIYSELMATVSTMVSAKPLQTQLIQSIAESFFESIFYNLTPFITPGSIHYHELKLVLDILPIPLPYYEKILQLNYLKEFQSALFNYQLVSLLDIRFLDFVIALIHDANHGISTTKKRNLIESIPIKCTLNHAIFDPLSNQQKSAFKAYLIEHHILVNDHIYYRKSELIKRSLETSKEYYESFTLLDKYILAQTTLLDSALTIIAQLGYILLYPADIARRHFIDLFGTIHDHEWVYINHLLPQTLNNQSVQDLLQKFINNTSSLSKETLKKHAISLRNISSPTPEISELFDTFRKQSATLVSSPQLPTSGNLLQTLMSALSENHQNS